MKEDITVLLGHDHQLLLRIMRELEAASDEQSSQVRFRHFAAALGGHLSAIRKVIYPALKALRWKDVSSDLLVGHAKLTHSFAELLTLPTDSVLFKQQLGALLLATRSLLECETQELLPLLTSHLDAVHRMSLALDARPYLLHDDADDTAARIPVAEWIEEARLLLGGAGLGASAPL
jgi:hypothetical protein